MRGDFVVILGGGATGITQANDSDVHQRQMAEMLRLARINPGNMLSAMVEQCID